MLRLRELRKSCGLTMKELGSILGVAESTVSQYETGKRQPDYETLLRLGEYFGVSVDYLLGAENGEDFSTMSQKIKRLRKEKGLTLEQVASVVGVGRSTVRKWETGMIANMRRDKIASLAKALGTTPAYLMGWEDDSPESNTSDNNIVVSPQAQKIAVAYDQATAKEKNIVEMILSAYLPAEEDRKAPVRFAAYSKDGKPVDFTGADPNAPIPHPFVKGDDIP